MGKGSKNERHLRDIYQNAGYWTYRPMNVQYGDNDMWNLFDLAALSPEHSDSVGTWRHIELVQCKTNRAAGIRQWFRDVQPFTDVHGLTVRFAVRHDREGWRLAGPTQNGYEWLYDGRDNGECIGDGLTAYLRGNNDA